MGKERRKIDNLGGKALGEKKPQYTHLNFIWPLEILIASDESCLDNTFRLRITWLIRVLICYPSAYASNVASNQIYRWCGSCIPEQVCSELAHLNRQRFWNTAVRVTGCYHGIRCFMDTANYYPQLPMTYQNSINGPNKRTIVHVNIYCFCSHSLSNTLTILTLLLCLPLSIKIFIKK